MLFSFIERIARTAFCALISTTAGAGVSPSAPAPPDGALGVPLSTTLTWTFPVPRPVLYGAATGGSVGADPSSLYTIDPDTGAATLIGAIGFRGVTGMAFAPNGNLYATANGDNLFGGCCSSILIKINPATGAGTLVGRIGATSLPFTPGRVPDIAFSPAGVLFGYGDNFGVPGPATDALLAINIYTAAPTWIGGTGFSGGGDGLEFGPAGILFATPDDAHCLLQLNPATGAGTCIPGSNGNVPDRINALAFLTSTGAMYASIRAGSQAMPPNESRIGRIDLATGLLIASAPTVLGLDAVAFANPAPVSYDVFFDRLNPPLLPLCIGAATPVCGAPPLLRCATYYWRVVATMGGVPHPGPVWSFSTGLFPFGDTDGDDDVDFIDLNNVLSSFGLHVGNPGYLPGADLDLNGVVDFIDLNFVLSGFGQGPGCAA